MKLLGNLADQVWCENPFASDDIPLARGAVSFVVWMKMCIRDSRTTTSYSMGTVFFFLLILGLVLSVFLSLWHSIWIVLMLFSSQNLSICGSLSRGSGVNDSMYFNRRVLKNEKLISRGYDPLYKFGWTVENCNGVTSDILIHIACYRALLAWNTW